ncbi:hypothetical protein B0H16DRAFT_91471 [Mycena metata]|uniref:Uncharacterized protein n=1 Tax=Mycena metata TaxID=1033252 RepID=A0AAD7IAQ1_9AGAR|nr:hypothetical protein B0H16DRAFT_91471 [Mycena metata]
MGREVEGGGLGRRTTTILGVSGAEQIAMATTMSSYPRLAYVSSCQSSLSRQRFTNILHAVDRSEHDTDIMEKRAASARAERQGKRRARARSTASTRQRASASSARSRISFPARGAVVQCDGQPGERASSVTADIAHRNHLCTRVHPARRSDAPAPASGKNQNHSSTPRVSRQWVIHRDQYVSAAKRRETKETIHSLPVGLPRIFHHHL